MHEIFRAAAIQFVSNRLFYRRFQRSDRKKKKMRRKMWLLILVCKCTTNVHRTIAFKKRETTLPWHRCQKTTSVFSRFALGARSVAEARRVTLNRVRAKHEFQI